ncbi:MAG TPA: S41 family peptidase, partial [Chlamydiales bacterium]|nr:S41 family peptidase [Chlamydiales bacterium]
MNLYKSLFVTIFLISLFLQIALEAKPAEINRRDVTEKMHEIMEAHASCKVMNPQVAGHALETFVEGLDPLRCYFLESEVEPFLEMDKAGLQKVATDFEIGQFPEFEKIFQLMQKAIRRRDELEGKIAKESPSSLPTDVSAKEFKEPAWCKTEDELYERLRRLLSLQLHVASKIGDDAREVALSRLKKRREKLEDDFFSKDQKTLDQFFCTLVLKSFASALDTHTNYFTPAEANQFLIAVQQRLLGIGVQMRDDVDGFTIVKIIEGGPAAAGKELKAKDKIIAINGEPVVGLDTTEVVERIRGPEGSDVVLRVVREIGLGSQKLQELKDIHIKRGEVVLKETRLETAIEPFGEGVIAHLKLHAFYQDNDSSSTEDLENALREIEKNHRIEGIVLDLRFNAGGVLSQAVSVTGLFIKKGIVVSIKDENGTVHH